MNEIRWNEICCVFAFQIKFFQRFIAFSLISITFYSISIQHFCIIFFCAMIANMPRGFRVGERRMLFSLRSLYRSLLHLSFVPYLDAFLLFSFIIIIRGSWNKNIFTIFFIASLYLWFGLCYLLRKAQNYCKWNSLHHSWKLNKVI